MARKKELEEKDELETEGGSEPRVYELSFHLDPELAESEAKRAYDAIREAITAKGSIVAEGTPEKVRLAYTIFRAETAGRRDFDSAYFCWIAYEADGEGHEAALAAAKEDARVTRFLDIRTTKDAAKHSAEMRELREKMPKAEEAVSDAELDAALETASA